MKRHTFTIGAVIAVFALSQAPAFGQAGSRPNTTGSSSGSAAPRGGDPGSGGSSAGTTSSSSGSAGSSSSSGTAVSRPSGGFGSGSAAAPRERAPQRPVAVPRSSAAAGGSTDARPSGDTRLSPGDPASRAVPAYSRPRDGRAQVGSAIDRHDAPPGSGSSIIYFPYNPGFYYDWRYGYSPYRHGLGYGFGFSSFWHDPFLYGGGYYGAPSYSAGGYSTQHRGGTGNLRLRVRPAEAHVYVDGYYVGLVDDFNGIFQRLNIDAGPHRIELRADGYETVEFEVFVSPGETITYRGDMKPQIP